MNREEARVFLNESGIKFSDIGSKDIAQLRDCLNVELKKFDNSGFKMQLIDTMRAEYNNDGSVDLCEIRVKGWIDNDEPYFESREAITFNRDGFVGFAGWADSKNVRPFIDAFITWIKTAM